MDNKFKISTIYAMEQIKNSQFSDHIIALILYGSVARNKVHEHSDVDLLLVVDDCITDKKELNQLKSKVIPLDKNLPEVDLHIHIGTKFPRTPYFKEIKKEGIILWKKKHTTH